MCVGVISFPFDNLWKHESLCLFSVGSGVHLNHWAPDLNYNYNLFWFIDEKNNSISKWQIFLCKNYKSIGSRFVHFKHISWMRFLLSYSNNIQIWQFHSNNNDNSKFSFWLQRDRTLISFVNDIRTNFAFASLFLLSLPFSTSSFAFVCTSFYRHSMVKFSSSQLPKLPTFCHVFRCNCIYNTTHVLKKKKLFK